MPTTNKRGTFVARPTVKKLRTPAHIVLTMHLININMNHQDPLDTPLPLESYKQETERVSRAEAAESKNFTEW